MLNLFHGNKQIVCNLLAYKPIIIKLCVKINQNLQPSKPSTQLSPASDGRANIVANCVTLSEWIPTRKNHNFLGPSIVNDKKSLKFQIFVVIYIISCVSERLPCHKLISNQSDNKKHYFVLHYGSCLNLKSCLSEFMNQNLSPITSISSERKEFKGII